MSEILIATGEGLFEPKPGDGELYFPDLGFEFVEESASGDVYGAVLTTLSTVLGYVQQWGVLFDVVDIGSTWIDTLDEVNLNRKFEDFLRAEMINLNSLSTRRGSSMNFMVQKFRGERVAEAHDGEVEVSTFLRIVPIGFGTDTSSALTYALAVKSDLEIREFDPTFYNKIDHDNIQHQRQWSTYLSVSITISKIKITRTDEAHRKFKTARDTAKVLRKSLLDQFDGEIDSLSDIWKDYRLASDYVASIENDKFRGILFAGEEANLRGFERAKRLEKSYRDAAARLKATRMLSHLSQVLSFASSVRNYVEVRDAKAEQKSLNDQRTEAFNKMNAGLADLKKRLDDQTKEIEAIKGEISNNDQKMIAVLVPHQEVVEAQEVFASEFNNDTQYLERPGPVDAPDNLSFSADLQFGGLRMKISF